MISKYEFKMAIAEILPSPIQTYSKKTDRLGDNF